MKEKELTIKKLKLMKPHTIFEYKVGRNEERTFMWVAVRGEIHDWAIYTSINAIPFVDYWVADKEGIAKNGQKMYDKEKIRELVPCDDEAFSMYRY